MRQKSWSLLDRWEITRMKINNLGDVVRQLKLKLPDFLELHDINPSRQFKCINPAHVEDKPSASLNPKTGNTQGKCFGACGESFDIFTAANWLENLPSEGPAWVNETIVGLAKRFNIPVEYTDITEEDKKKASLYRAYAEANRYISDLETGTWIPEIEDYLTEYNFDKKFLSENGVGVITEAEYISYMTGRGYSVDYLVDSALLSPRGSNNAFPIRDNQLIFTIYDEYARVVGFSGRNFTEKNLPKYVNTRTTPIYSKEQTLYNLSTAKNIARQGQQLIVFEGYSDVLSAKQHSIDNCVATCGTALTVKHLELLRAQGCSDILLSYDFDDAGQQATQRIIENTLTQVPDVRVSIPVIEDEKDKGKDPAEFISSNGHQEFLELRQLLAFNWLLNRYLEQDIEFTEASNRLIPVIASEPNAIIRDNQVSYLAEKTNVAKYAIETEVRKRTEEAVAKKEFKRRNILSKHIKEINEDPTDAINIMEKNISDLENLESEHDAGRYSAKSFVHLIETQYEKAMDKDPDNRPGFNLPFLPHYTKCLSDGQDWKYGHFMALGGNENCGKSSLLTYITYNIACCDENDALCIYWSIDDSAPMIFPKFVTSANVELQGYVPTQPGEPVLDINHVINPRRSTQGFSRKETNAILSRLKKANERLTHLANMERLILKDGKDGRSLIFLRGMLRYYRSKYPSKPIYAVIDNMHNLDDHKNIEGHNRYKELANSINNICTDLDVTTMCSVEYRKDGNDVEPDKIRPPSNDKIAESRAIKYLAKWIGHIYNDIKIRPTKHYFFHKDPITEQKLPRIHLYHSKSKINSYSGIDFLDFYPQYSAFKEVSFEDAILEKEKFIKESNDQDDH